MSTVRDLITAAMLDLGAIASGEAPTAAEGQDALRRLNLMLELWRLQSLLVYTVNPITVPQTGQQTYTIGAGGDINIERPVRLENAIQRVSSGSTSIDYPLSPLNHDDFQALAIKGLAVSVASWFYYDGGFPLANFRTWPVLPSGQTVILYPWKALMGFGSLNDTVTFPPGYELALQTNLSLQLAPMFRDSTPTELLVMQAEQSLNLIKMNNYRLAILQTPIGIPTMPNTHTGTDRIGFLTGWFR